MEQLPRPKSTKDLIQRLTELSSDSSDGDTTDPQIKSIGQHLESKRKQVYQQQERFALQALLQAMVRAFHHKPEISYFVEAAAISLYTSLENYNTLCEDFSNVIGHGAGDSTIPDVQLLAAFNNILQCPQALELGDDSWLVVTLQSLSTRLRVASSTPKIQYQVICALSGVLDKMNEIKSKGISDQHVIQPLIDQLDKASKSPEIRLAQAAQYARQALRGIPGDVGPWKKLWDSTYNAIKGAAKVASSISSLDPDRLLQGLDAILNEAVNAKELYDHIIDIIESTESGYDNLSNILKSANGLKKPAKWYIGLRYTDLLIQAKARGQLEHMLNSPKLNCRKDEEFVCGLCAQLETAIASHHLSPSEDEDNAIIKVVKMFVGQKGKDMAGSGVVQAWVGLICEQPVESHNKVGLFQRMRNHMPAHAHSTSVKCQRTQPLVPGGELLSVAWEECHEAKVFYADQRIRDYYTDTKFMRLEIQRLSGDALPMEQCYINLAIVDKPNTTKDCMPEYGNFTSTLESLKISEPPGSSLVYLPKLFGDSESNHEKTPYKRVLILGEAGIGKSTLCKKMVYDFIHNKMWCDIIDRVIWLPLRDLKNSTSGSIKELLFNKYFQDLERHDGQLLTDAIWQEVEQDQARTLFILDGYDEVSGSKINDITRNLLNQSRVVISTRPYAKDEPDIKNIGLTVETFGFYPSQLKNYIAAVTPEQKAQERILNFIEKHPLIKGLARIPIQLDAICYSFTRGPMLDSAAPQTMTGLYGLVERALWNKDVDLLERESKETAWKSYGPDVRGWTQGEVNVLQSLAFTGLYSNTVEFNGTYMEQFWKWKDDVMSNLPQVESKAKSADLDKLSFLRTSRTSKELHRHFLHSTFQDFFAAQYFVEHWKDKELTLMVSDKNKIQLQRIYPEDFLRKHKYNARYHIFWRFVAGMLQNKNDDELYHFFSMLDKEPRDLLGAVHQRLILHCLSEVPLAQDAKFEQLRETLKDQLKQWVLLELKFVSISPLAIDMEFPEGILESGLNTESVATAKKIRNSLNARPDRVLNRLKRLVTQLHDKEPEKRSEAARKLKIQQMLPEDVLFDLAAQLQDGDPNIRSNAAAALGGQKSLPESIINTLVKQTKYDHDKTAQNEAFHAIMNQDSPPPHESLQEYVRKQMDTPEIRDGVNKSIERVGPMDKHRAVFQSIRNDADLSTLIPLLKDQDPRIRFAAALIHGKQRRKWPMENTSALGKLLDDEEIPVSEAAARALATQADLPPGVVSALVTKLKKDRRPAIRCAAVQALQNQLRLSDKHLLALMAALQDGNPTVESAAADAIHMQVVHLLSDKQCGRFLLKNDCEALKFLYGVWLMKGFNSQITLMADRESCHVDLPNKSKTIPIPLSASKKAIRAVRESLGIPVYNSVV